MEAIVLAGGLGTRLRAVVADVPKPMAPVAGQPFLALLLAQLQAHGIRRAVLSVGYRSELIMAYFAANAPPLEIAYEVEEQALGTGGAIAAALRHVRDDAVFVFNGDTYLDLDIGAVAARWPGDRSPVVVVREVADTARFGRLELDGDRIREFAGAGVMGPGLINAGCYLLPHDLFEGRGMPRAFSFEQDYLARCPALALRAFVTDAEFIDIGVPDDYHRAQVQLARLVRGPRG